MKREYNQKQLKNVRRKLRYNETDAEKLIWQKLRNRGFYGYKFFRQYSIGSYVLDFYCTKEKLAIEVDGGQHGEEDIISYDKERTEYLNEKAIRVVRFWNNDVMNNIEGVLERLEEFITPPSLPLS